MSLAASWVALTIWEIMNNLMGREAIAHAIIGSSLGPPLHVSDEHNLGVISVISVTVNQIITRAREMGDSSLMSDINCDLIIGIQPQLAMGLCLER